VATIQQVTASAVTAALQRKYSSPAWALIFQVRSQTGFATGARPVRTADAVALGLWPSRGLELLGFEIKVDRGDWLRELRQPAKADLLVQFCDRWWVVAGDPSVVQAGELPPTWGLQVLTRRGLRVEVEAPTLDAVPLDRPFLASLVRRVIQEEATEAQLRAAEARGVELGRRSMQGTVAEYQERAERYQQAIRAFEEAAGIRIQSWSAGQLGEAVRAVLNGGQDGGRSALESTRATLQTTLDSIDGALKALTNPQAAGGGTDG
jgi:hypothetical protein